MQTIICKDFDAMSKWAADKVAEEIRRKPDALISFPGGDTPLGMVREFARMVNAGEVDISKARFVMLDEWVGLNENDEGSCARFMKDNLFDLLEKPFAEVCLFDGRADDIEAERAKHEAFIKEHGPITVSVLGIGMNGHLGFNESGVDFSLSSHIIPLHPVTRQVMSKYFGGRELPLTHGITQGIAQIMAADTVLVIANGAKKADIVRRAIEEPVTNEVPASVIQNHPNGYFVLDEAAAADLKK